MTMEYKDWKKYQENKSYLMQQQYKKNRTRPKLKNQKPKNGKLMRSVYYIVLSVCIMQVTEVYSIATYKPKPAETVSLANEFSPKLYTNVEINEPNGTEYELVSDKVQNEKGEKIAYFQNPIANTKPEYIRAKIVAVIKDSNGNAVGSDFSLVYKFGSDEATWGWVKGEDGYYYYKTVVNPGESTSNLLVNLSITSPTAEQLASGSVYIEFNVLADTVEASGTDSMEAAITAWGVNPQTGVKVH